MSFKIKTIIQSSFRLNLDEFERNLLRSISKRELTFIYLYENIFFNNKINQL